MSAVAAELKSRAGARIVTIEFGNPVYIALATFYFVNLALRLFFF
jgi:hypothetical protein